jgi:hypothetical protein
MRQSARLPTWAQVTFAVFLMWPCVVVPRWRLFGGLGILTAAGLWVAQWWCRVDELSWGVMAGLSTIHNLVSGGRVGTAAAAVHLAYGDAGAGGRTAPKAK